MIELHGGAVEIKNGVPVPANKIPDREGTMAYKILRAHSARREKGQLHIKFDSLISHDITYVGIIQTAKASGLTEFPLPYVMTNCHNSLCAVGGTINEDDHVFGLSAAVKYGGCFVPANMAVIHQYAREMMSGCGKMILGSDSHTRYGAIGTMGIGEGGPEIVKQLLKNTYDIADPEVILVWLTGSPKRGVGPHDVAIALCGAIYKNGFVKNRVLEFAGPGVTSLPMDYRIGIDVMTTETACLSSIWETDGAVTLRELMANPGDILREVELRAEKQFGGKARLSLTDKIKNGRLTVDQGIIAGCAGGMYDNIAEAAAILKNRGTGNGYFSLSVYPPSVPVNLELIQSGIQQSLLESGALFKPCFCGPCFGAGDVPANNALSIRHTTRNFPNREGSKPADGQLSGVILMDARSIAATAANGGMLTSAADVDYDQPVQHERSFDRTVYDRRVYFGFGRAKKDEPLRLGPNITEWPNIPALGKDLLLNVASVLLDPVTTTDELIPSGETSSYRSNPLKLATFALSRRDPGYVGRAKAVQELEKQREKGILPDGLKTVFAALGLKQDDLADIQIGSAIYSNKPGDGSAREQAASCQRVLGGCANICLEFATKRYRSNCVNWGILPFTVESGLGVSVGDFIYVPDVRSKVENGDEAFAAKLVSGEKKRDITLYLKNTTAEERELLLTGCLMNHYAAQNRE